MNTPDRNPSVLPFVKMDGAGNDFILIDNRAGVVPDRREELVRALCHRTRSVGADGVILLEDGNGEAQFRMRYYNADGLEADMCGNGARCVARFAAALGIEGSPLRFATGAGLVRAYLDEESVRVGMGDAVDLELGTSWAGPAGDLVIHSVRSGVPHVVIFLEENPSLGHADVRAVPGETVVSLGRAIRRDPRWAPEGTNVDFVTVTGRSALAYRTYERGVEGETLACGTGAVGAGVVAAHRELVTPPLELETAGGDLLGVSFRATETGATEVFLDGPARVNFEGIVRLA